MEGFNTALLLHPTIYPLNY